WRPRPHIVRRAGWHLIDHQKLDRHGALVDAVVPGVLHFGYEVAGLHLERLVGVGVHHCEHALQHIHKVWMRMLVLGNPCAGRKRRKRDDDVGMIGHDDRLADDCGVGARDRRNDNLWYVGGVRDGKSQYHSQWDDKRLHGSSSFTQLALVHAQPCSQQGLSPSYPTAMDSCDNDSWIIIRNLAARTRTGERFGGRVSKSQKRICSVEFAAFA